MRGIVFQLGVGSVAMMEDDLRGRHNAGGNVCLFR